MKLERLLAITIILLNNDKVQAKELAERFDVSLRTIYRDLDTISFAGIPVISYPGNNGGYGIIDTFKIDKHIFTDADIEFVLSTLKGFSATFPDSRLDSALEKLINIGLSRNKDIKQIDDKIIADMFKYNTSAKHKEYHKKVYYSISNNLVLNLDYCNSLGESANRNIEPMTLVFRNYSWYIFAFCRLKNDFRFFKLTRITNLNISVNSFVRKEAKYAEHDSNPEQNTNNIELILKFSPKAKFRIEEYFSEQIIKNLPDDSTVVSFNWKEDEWMYSFILSYGEDAEVVSPIHVRDIIQNKVKNICKLYQS